MSFIEGLAQACIGLIDLFFFDFLMLAVYHVDKDGNIKLRLDYIFGPSTYRRTNGYVLTTIILGMTYFVTMNIFQQRLVALMVSFFGVFGMYLLATFLVALVVFWVCKVNLGRKFKFPLVYLSFAALIITFLALALYLTLR